MVICNGCIGSCKSNYHRITATMDPQTLVNILSKQNMILHDLTGAVEILPRTIPSIFVQWPLYWLAERQKCWWRHNSTWDVVLLHNKKCKWYLIVKLIYKEHSMEPENVFLMSSCPLYTGHNYMHYSLKRKMRLPFIDSDLLYRGLTEELLTPHPSRAHGFIPRFFGGLRVACFF